MSFIWETRAFLPPQGRVEWINHYSNRYRDENDQNTFYIYMKSTKEKIVKAVINLKYASNVVNNK